MKILLLTLFTILCFIDLSSNHKSKFEDFLKNQEAMNLIKSYKENQIKSIKDLHVELTKRGIQLGICTLKIYLGKIKSIIPDTSNESPGLEMKFEKCLSRDLSNTIYLIGSENNWRKYRMMNENITDLYIACTKCYALQNKEKRLRPIIARAIIRGGEKLVITQAEHNPKCEAETMEVIKAEQVDRKQRKEIFKCNSDVKTIWRQGLEKVREEDAQEDVDSLAENSLTNHYPSWIEIRRSYNRRRQQAHGSEAADPFDVPPRLQLTKFGAIKLIMGKKIAGSEWMIYKNQETGVMIFASQTQLDAVRNCRIMVADATFELAPKGFRQIWLIHGLYKTNDGAEWVVLAFALMRIKDQLSYETVLNELHRKWGTETVKTIERIHVDYERAEINAFNKIFGEKKVFGCLVHFIRAALRHIQTELPLLWKEYIHQKKESGPVWKHIRKLLALPTIPKKNVVRIWPHLKAFEVEKNINENLKEFHRYYEREWIKKLESGNLWNFYNLARTRNTNPAESWHSAIKRDRNSVRHASLGVFLHFFQTVMSEVDDRIVKLQNEKTKPRPRAKLYETLDENLLKTLNEYETVLPQIQNEDDFTQTTEHFLNRISFLLLQMNDSGTKTKKDARLDERKRNSFEIHTVNSKKPKESANLNQDEIVIEPSEEIVLEPNEEIIIEKEGKILLEHEEVVIQGDEIIITEKEIIVSESGESLPKSKGHKGMKFIFNPPTDCERYNFCEAWDYICEEPEKDFLAPFEFETINYGPGIVQPIEGDGNCGFRSISWALTGSEVNHDEIRKDLMEYLEETLYQYSLEPIGNDWWQMFFDRVEDARKHIEIKKSPARSAAENDKWMSEPDMFIAAKMFKINVISYKPADNPDHIWQIFTPQMQNSLLNPIQDLEAPSIFIYNQLGHFEVIIQPERLSHKND